MCLMRTNNDTNGPAIVITSIPHSDFGCIVRGRRSLRKRRSTHIPFRHMCSPLLVEVSAPVMALARGMGALRLSAAQKNALYAGQLTIISPFAATDKRVNADQARQRNRFVAALADEIVFAHVSKGGSLEALREAVQHWSVQTTTLVDSP